MLFAGSEVERAHARKASTRARTQQHVRHVRHVRIFVCPHCACLPLRACVRGCTPAHVRSHARTHARTYTGRAYTRRLTHAHARMNVAQARHARKQHRACTYMAGTRTRTRTRTHLRARARTHVCHATHMHACTHVHTRMRVRARTRALTRTHAHAHMHTRPSHKRLQLLAGRPPKYSMLTWP